ncbi:MAG: DNA-processing protein DprA, partial [Alphaproteobacteria bacterium]|nr:DNA-processing protein DprA [Alphaproteobacteria bacterium]
MLSKSEVIDILQLISSENLGPATFYKLVKEFGSAKVAINNAHKLKKIRLLGRERAEELYKRLHNFGAKIITVYDEEYPNTLHAMNDMAPILFALGNIELLKAEKAISIVGARNASINGRKTASRIAFDLTNSGIVVVSGM